MIYIKVTACMKRRSHLHNIMPKVGTIINLSKKEELIKTYKENGYKITGVNKRREV